MENLDNTKQSAQNTKETFLCLKAIQSLIKATPYRELAYDMLGKIEATLLSPEHLVYYHYLNGRYFMCRFREDQDIDSLEWANDFFDDMVSIAYTNKVKVSDTRFLFSRAYVKFQLAQLVWDCERKPWLLDKAKHITETTLKFNPENESFLWLQKQLVA